MSYIYLQEQGEESLAESFSDIPACVLSRLNLIADRYYSNGNGTESCQSSRSGMMSELSMENRGEGKSMSSAVASPAKTSARLARDEEYVAIEAPYGSKWRVLSEKLNRVSCSSKTAGELFSQEWEEFSATWPKWGMMRAGVLWEHPAPVLRKGGKGSGWWPTPTASDSIRCRKWPEWLARHRDKQHSHGTGGASGIFEVAASEFSRLPKVTFSEWLNGIPEKWLNHSEPLEIYKFRQWLNSLGRH